MPDYDPRPGGRFEPFEVLKDQGFDQAPYDWPQDTLRVPDGFGTMIPVESLNASLTKREGFGLSTTFANVNMGVTISNVIQVPKDGDFWAEDIAAMVIDATGNQQNIILSLGYLQLVDVATGYAFFPVQNTNSLADGIPLAMLNPSLQPNIGAGANQSGFNPAGARESWLQPYCFLRGTTIQLKLTVPLYCPVVTANWSVYVNLNGWKEYANAAN